jgi:exonuclease SbcC
MIRRIILDNYMAHVHTVIDPVQGLTVLTGPNNCGKSAIIHALEMICYNSDAADYAIRHGAKKAVVTMETVDDDGTAHTIVWWRKRGTAGYIIDGREISGLGKSNVPDDLHRYLRMPMIESGAGGKEFLLHFGLQKSPIFLLDDPASRAAQFFASATDADRLVQMQKTHQLKVRDATHERERLDGEIEQLDRQLETLSPLSELSVRLGAVEDQHRDLESLNRSTGALQEHVREFELSTTSVSTSAEQILALDSLQKPPILPDTKQIREWIDAAEHCQNDVTTNHARAGVLRGLSKPPELVTTGPLMQTCNEMAATLRQIAIEQDRAEVLATLAPMPPLHDIVSMRAAIDNLQNSLERETLLETDRAILATLPEPPALYDTHAVQETIGRLAASIDARARLKAKADALSRVTHPPDLIDLELIKNSIGQLEGAIRAESERADESRTLDGQVQRFRRQLEQWIRKNPRCKACGQPITAELVVTGGHAHE